MSRDWLVEGERTDRARLRLVEIASTMIRQNGVDKFDINELARRAYCSRATVYRHVGGKNALIEAVLTASSAHVTTLVAERTGSLRGRERAETALSLALREIRADPVVQQLLRSRRLHSAVPAALASPTISDTAIALLGLDDNDAAGAQWVVRGFLALALWPPSPEYEAAAVRALVVGVIDDR